MTAPLMCDAQGKPLSVGSSEGYWLDEQDFIFSGDDGRSAERLGAHGFPRGWPSVYTESRPLKSLIGKKGVCAAKKVGVVAAPTAEQTGQISGLDSRELQSFANAEKVKAKTGMA